MRVQKNDESLREKVGSALALRLARLGGDTSVPPDYAYKEKYEAQNAEYQNRATQIHF